MLRVFISMIIIGLLSIIFYQFQQNPETIVENMIESALHTDQSKKNASTNGQFLKKNRKKMMKMIEDMHDRHQKKLKARDYASQEKMNPSPKKSKLNIDPPSTQTMINPADMFTEDTKSMIYSTDREGIKYAFRDTVKPAVKECYQAWLQSNPSLAGKIKIKFTITQNEEHEEAQVKEASLLYDGVQHPMMSACILNAVDHLQFENLADQEEITVHYPMTFESPTTE